MLEVDVSKTFDGARGPVKAIERIHFSVDEDEFVSVVGPSGCGKTTLLRCIAGLAASTSGVTRLRGEPVTAPPPELAVVFQDYARSLFPWLTVRKNVMLPLRSRRDMADKGRAASEAIDAVGLS